jgi:hypothetical protein
VDLNGGRGLHWSREFFRDPSSGEVVGVQEALRRSAPRGGEVWYAAGFGPWMDERGRVHG